MFVGRLFRNRINQVAFLSFLAITCITFFKSALELEDAEQAYYSQWLRWGYDDQPPLYSWLQYFVNKVFGVNKVSFSILRAGIFASVLMAMWHFSRKMLTNESKSEIAVLLLVLLPVFIDFTFRRLSHTSLLCLSILASVIMIDRLLKAKTWTNYAFLGLVISIGMLSKYNYLFFLVAIGFTLFFDASIRKIILDKKFLLTVSLVLLLLFPHIHWLFGSEGYVMELQKSIALKTENTAANSFFIIGPLFSLVITFLKLTAPLLAVFIVAFALGKVTFKRPNLDWFTKLALAQLSVLVLFFLCFNVQKVEARWLLPLLLPFMVLLLRSVEFKSVKKWATYLYALFITIIVFQTLRTPVEKMLDIPSSVHFSFVPLSDRLNKNFKDQLWLLPDVTYGGNIRILNPNKEIFASDDFSVPKSKLGGETGIEVVVGTDSTKGRLLLEQLFDFGKEKDTLSIVGFKRDIPSFERMD